MRSTNFFTIPDFGTHIKEYRRKRIHTVTKVFLLIKKTYKCGFNENLYVCICRAFIKIFKDLFFNKKSLSVCEINLQMFIIFSYFENFV